jgi:DNA adenine methylase
MISGYHSELYSIRLAGWRTSSFWTVDRRGNPKEEICWMNFAAPQQLHDARFVGGNFTDRQRVRRKCERWKRKFAAMAPGERTAILDALRDPMVESDNDGRERLADTPTLL